MKHILPVSQIILLMVAAILIISVSDPDEKLLTLAWWQMITGGVQLTLAFILSFKHWYSPLGKFYVIYWILVNISLALPGLRFFQGDLATTILFFIIPWCIATYFSVIVFISCYCKKYRYEK